MGKIQRINWLMAVVCVAYSALMLIIGWWAIASLGFDSDYVLSAGVATVAFALAVGGFVWQKPWVLGAGMVGVMLFCPSPLGIAPMFIGFAIVVFFGFFYMKKVDETGQKGWSRHEA